MVETGGDGGGPNLGLGSGAVAAMWCGEIRGRGPRTPLHLLRTAPYRKGMRTGTWHNFRGHGGHDMVAVCHIRICS